MGEKEENIPKYCICRYFDSFTGASGNQSKLIEVLHDDQGIFLEGTDHYPKVGYAMWVGEEGTENWWQTTPITKIDRTEKMDKDGLMVYFYTKNSFYIWSTNSVDQKELDLIEEQDAVKKTHSKRSDVKLPDSFFEKVRFKVVEPTEEQMSAVKKLNDEMAEHIEEVKKHNKEILKKKSNTKL